MIAVFNTSYIKPVAHSILSLLKKSRHNYQQVTCFWTLTRYSTHGLICCLPRLAVQCRLLELPSFMAGCFLMTIQIQFAGHATMIWVGSKSVYHVLAGVLFIGELQSSGRCANCLMTSHSYIVTCFLSSAIIWVYWLPDWCLQTCNLFPDLYVLDAFCLQRPSHQLVVLWSVVTSLFCAPLFYLHWTFAVV